MTTPARHSPFGNHQIHFDPSAGAEAACADAMRRKHGMRCTGQGDKSRGSHFSGWALGEVEVARAEMAALELTPVDASELAHDGPLYFKLVTAGQTIVEQAGRSERLDAGGMLAVDPVHGFIERIPERSSMIVLRIPKSRLRERGWKPTTDGLIVPDMPSADVKAVGELIQSIVNQSDTPSHEMRSWLGDQLINAVGFLLAARHKTPSRRSAEAIVSRAKAYISQHLGVEDLDAETIAAAVNVSVKHLQRLFRSEGESPMRHLWQVRLAHAERLLRAGGPEAASVQEIAWQCGFSTAAHFSRVFKQRYGVSPGSIKGIPGGVQEIYLL